ncbi:MAG: hypothetical protein KDA96_15300, partial [Planctomycetaceae bacterium]|nr:hypothetical protein [Planctomycetaceae bacterium]
MADPTGGKADQVVVRTRRTAHCKLHRVPLPPEIVRDVTGGRIRIIGVPRVVAFSSSHPTRRARRGGTFTRHLAVGSG